MIRFGPIVRPYPGTAARGTTAPPSSPVPAAELAPSLTLAVLAVMGCPDLSAAVVVTIEGEPRSKARPRFTGNGRPYSDPKQKANQDYLIACLRPHFPKQLPGNLAVAAVFYRSTRQSIDTDNMLKQLLDAGKNLCWDDDRQVTAVAGVTHLDRTRPRIEVAVAPHVSTLDRAEAVAIPCQYCRKMYKPRYGSKRKFCSRKCASHSIGQDLTAEVSCRFCLTPFRRKNAGMVFCSDDCRLKSLNAKVTPIKPVCGKCGKRVSRREYLVCRSCWKNG